MGWRRFVVGIIDAHGCDMARGIGAAQVGAAGEKGDGTAGPVLPASMAIASLFRRVAPCYRLSCSGVRARSGESDRGFEWFRVVMAEAPDAGA